MFQEIQGYQLSPQQKYLWQLQQPDNQTYQVKSIVSITGNLDIEILKNAIEQVVNRHEILRTCYQVLPGMSIPVQVITDSGINWQQNHDLTKYTDEEQKEKLPLLFEKFSQQTFNLETGNLLHLSLIALSANRYKLFISLPALSADRYTLKNLVKEISCTYANKYNSYEEVMQYADLATWQNELLSAADTEAGREYWLKQDFSALQALHLPLEKENIAEFAFQPETYTFSLNAHLVEQITTQYQSSVANFFLACWNILLWRLTGQENLVIGVATNGRKYQELESALGLLSKYVPLTWQVKEDITLSQLLNELNQAVAKNYNYQEYFSWDKLADLPGNNLYFEYDEIREEYNFDDISFTIDQLDACFDSYKIKLACIRLDNLIHIELTYNTFYFNSADIQRLAAQFQVLIESALSQPEAIISQLKILSNSEIQLLTALNDTKLDYPVDKCIHHLFEEQVAKTPNKIAIVFADQAFTYAELNHRANQIATYLQQLGVGGEVLVGLCVERSLDIVLGILGILKAGGAYVPLDPTYPKERLAYMLQNSQPKVLLTKEYLIEELPEHSALLVCLDKDWNLISQQSSENLNQTAISTNLAYIIYTSGSTGTPKGVRVTHANLCHYVQAMQTALGIVESDRYLHTASIAFSSSVRQLMVPLTKGATVVIATSEQRKDPLTLFAEIKQQQVTVIDIVPSYWRNCNHLLSSLKPELRTTLLDNKLRLIVSASEPLLSDICTQWRFGLQHHASLINMFGQTETCGIVAVYPIAIAQNQQIKIIPLGRPIPNTQIYILDKYLQPVPLGVAGEIYIGGLGIGQGYLHRPDLTAERFIPNFLSQEPGTRLYKTGDLGRYLPDGTVEFIGRSDHQVKIRGFRIELAEIEAVLCQHPSVREAVVVAREDVGEKRLIAYIVSNDHSVQNPNFSNYRSFLKERLPDYMMPSNFVMLEALPLTPNGKLNRQALPAPEQLQTQSQKTPRTLVEEVIAGIWAQILHLDFVGIDDNFFELGGHSLLATQVVSKIREILQIDLPLRSLFESPTVAALAERVELALNVGEKQQISPIKTVVRDGKLPVSFAQQRLWFLDQLEPGSNAYNLSRTVRLQGVLNIAALEQSLNEIVRRHEVLRTTFTAVDGQAVQVIASTLSIKLPVVDLSNFSNQTQEIEAKKLAKQQAQQSFDLTTGPLFNAILLQLSEQEYVLVFTIHHIIADGWSTGVIVQELTALYESFCNNKPSVLKELPIQYADFAVWQREWLQNDVLVTQLNYWKQQLSGSLPVLELPTDRPRPAIQTFVGRKQSFQISPSLTAALKTLSQQSGVTLFMTILAAFQTLLYRYTQQEDILVGSPIANRNRVEIEGLIGFFVNTLVLRTNLSGNPSFLELLKRVREVTIGAYTHQDLPFEQLVEELQPERNLSYTPLFQVMFALQNAPLEELKLSGLTINLEEVDTEKAAFDLTLFLTESNQGLMGVFEYNSDLFDAATISRMQGHFQTLLEGIVTNSNRQLSDLPILTAAEQQLLIDLNATETDYPCVCIHQLFEAQVERTPNAVAVVFENKQLTYQELNKKANQLAHYLQKMGVGPEVLVGICVERSLEMVVGVLGILKAGGAYVPLDPAYPQERLAFMLNDSQVPVLLTQQNLLKNLPTEKAKVVCLDSHWEIFTYSSPEKPVNRVTPENLAYVIYTSGSTGKPKGAMNTHRAICNRLLWMQDYCQLTPKDRVLQKTPFSFDVSVWEFFLPLLTGARLVVARPDGHRDTNYLIDVIAHQQITTLHFVPSMLQMFLQTEGLKACQSLKQVICSGEALPVELQKRFFTQINAQLHNLYGPTEAAVDVTFWKCIAQTNSYYQTVPIGSPIANTQIYLLDQNLNPVPIGVTGELYIGGVGIGRGYLNNPQLTADKFIPNPFSHQSGERLYKTGDLAHYLPDGIIEYLGRIDYQIKLRGFRIELGEIEAALEQHPAVRQCVVIVREDVPGHQRLVAYLVADNGITDELRQYLRQKLPEYMIPSAFVILDSLPLTPNGKVNRRALPTPDISSRIEEGFVAPYTRTQEILAAIWAEVLGLEEVSIHDNFFELGGDSILSIQIVARINQAGFQTTPKQLFQHQTIAKLAAVVGTSLPVQAQQGVVTGEISLTPIQHWFFEQNLPEPHHFNQSVLLEVPPDFKPALLEQVLQQLLVHHDTLRLRFVQDGDRWLQVNAASEQTVPFSVVNLSEIAPQEQQTAIKTISAELQASLNLSQGPLLRVALFNLGSNQPGRLLLIIHHLAVDGVSWRILLADLFNTYQQLSQGKTIQLPAKTTSFQQWSEKLQEYANSANLHSQLDYWLTILHKSVESLPVDYPGGNNSQQTACTLSVALSVEETQALLQDVPTTYRTQINEVLLTAFIHTFKQWTGQTSLLIDMEGHGREDIFDDVDLSRTVGWFTSIYPVFLDIGNAANLKESLQKIKEQMRSIPDHGFGYGVLRYLSRQSDILDKIQSQLQPKVIFNYLGQLDQLLPESSLFKLAKESTQVTRSLRGNRYYLLEVNGMVIDGHLQLQWSYSQELHRQETVENLAENMIEALRSLINYSQSGEVINYTPADFPDAELSQTQLNQIFAELELE